MGPSVTYVGHSTVLVDVGGFRILTDPVLRDTVTFLRRVGTCPQIHQPVDAIVLSHLHHDHCDLPSLRQFPDIPIICPDGAGDFLEHALQRRVTQLPVGQSIRMLAATITAVPALHDGSRPPFGPTATASGFVMSGAAGAVYFAGDTDLFAEMSGLRDIAEIDVALIPVWGWGPNLGTGHLNPARAARAVERIQPRSAVPIHWGTFFPVAMQKVLPSASVVLNRPPVVFAELTAKYAPATHVEVLSPGMSWMPND